MDIINVIVHKLSKEKRVQGKPQPPTTIKLRPNELLRTNPIILGFLDKVAEAFKTGKTFGTFNDDIPNHPVQTWLGEMLDITNPRSFIDLSNDVMSRLKFFIEDINFATGGHLLFTLYKDDNDKNWFMIAMLKDRYGYTFTDDLNIENIQEIDIDNLHQLARVDIERWQSGPGAEGYLSFKKKSAGDVSAYFTDALGCTNLIPSKEATNNIFSIVDSLFIEAKMGDTSIASMKDQLYTFMEARRPRTVNLAELAILVEAQLPQEFHNRFIQIANSDEYRVSDEFEPHQQALRAQRRIKYKNPNWSLDIERSALGTPESDAELIYDEENKTLTIRELPDSLADDIKRSIDRNKTLDENG